MGLRPRLPPPQSKVSNTAAASSSLAAPHHHGGEESRERKTRFYSEPKLLVLTTHLQKRRTQPPHTQHTKPCACCASSRAIKECSTTTCQRTRSVRCATTFGATRRVWRVVITSFAGYASLNALIAAWQVRHLHPRKWSVAPCAAQRVWRKS